MKFWTIVYAYSYGVSIKSARWLTEEVDRLRRRLDRLQAEWAEAGLPVNA